ncbi:hypothetical protein NP233_g2528 [Leucocoprinus birnbaumii]|uniref:Rhodanese domain-containing protein n=1 Tax=Leucocoprinus birnbaumii TaxID=56174 RepID=A0AAD5W4E6_9AGAR|nr:hypothetical protein NP233_g2528 [Leucocoprinus birnbaumii]
MTTRSSSTPAPSYQSPQFSPPPQYTVVPPTPTQQNGSIVTRLRAQQQPQPTPISTTLTEANAATSPVRSNSTRSVLSRRVRSLRLSPTVTIRSGPKDEQHARSSSGSAQSPTRLAGSLQYDAQPQLPHISRVSPILPPSQLPLPTAVGPPTEIASTSRATEGHNAHLIGRHIQDFEQDAPPSPGSIASTGITPSLMVKRAQLEKRIFEAMNDGMPDSIHPNQQSEFGETADMRDSVPNKSLEISSKDGESVNLRSSPAKEQEARSLKLSKLLSLASPLSHKSSSKHSQRSVSQPTTKSSHQLLERHPNQLFVMQPPTDQHLDVSNASTPRLSYASLPGEPAQPTQHEQTPPDSEVPPPRSDPPSYIPVGSPEHSYKELPTQGLLRHPSSAEEKQSQTLHAPADNDREGSRVALSSVDGSPRRSIPLHDSPVPMRESGSERTTTPVPSPPKQKLRRKKLEPITSLEVQDPTSPTAAGAMVPRPLVVVEPGDAGDVSTMSNGSYTTGTSEPAQIMLYAEPPPVRTLDSVRSQVAREIALRAVSDSNVVDGVRVGVTDASSAWSGPNDIPFIHLISSSINASYPLPSSRYLYIITATSFSPTPSASSTPKGETTPKPNKSFSAGLLYITSSSRELTSRAVHLTCSKFVGRITSSSFTFSTLDIEVENAGDPSLGLATQELEWMARIKELHFSSFDSDIIHSILLTASRTPLDPTVPPPHSKSINTILEEARAKLTRITPRQALTQMRTSSGDVDVPTLLVDIRSQKERDEWGEVPGAICVERNVLEWRFDPRSEKRLSVVDRYDLRVIVFCQDGSASSLAAHSLQRLGLLNATDMIGGFKAWRDARLPVEIKPTRERSLVSAAGSIV